MDIGVDKHDVDGPGTRNQRTDAPAKGAVEARSTKREVNDDERFDTDSRSGGSEGGVSGVDSAEVLPTDAVDNCCGAVGDMPTTQLQQSPNNDRHEGPISPMLSPSSLGDSQYHEDTHSEGSVAENYLVGIVGGSIDEDSIVTKDTTTVSNTAPTPRAARAAPPAGSPDPGTDTSGTVVETDKEWNLQHDDGRRCVGLSEGATRQFDGGASSGNDLPAQLNRLWGQSLPDRVAELAAMQEMLGNRQALDGILSRLASTKGAAEDALSSRNLASNASPFTLAMLAERFAPAVVEPSELRERGLTRVRVVTAAGLKVGLAKRVFARVPLLPSDVEAEEEEQSRRSEASPTPVERESLRALVVPVASTAAAPETSPEETIMYPSMGDVCSTMWCEEDDDEDAHGDNGQGSAGGSAKPRRRLRFSVQTLDGHVCDDEDEDSETDDDGGGSSGTDVDDLKAEYSDGDRYFGPARTDAWRARRARKGDGGMAAAVAVTDNAEEAGGGRAKGCCNEEEGDGLGYRRREELASVLRRLRAAIRTTDGVLSEEKVSALAKHVVRVAALAASSSELVTATAARGAMRGLGDRIRLETLGYRNGTFRWVTVYVGTRRWGRHYFGPGFAVETQEKFRLGWLRMSHAAGVVGEGASGDTPAARSRLKTRGWGARRGFLGLGRRTEIHGLEAEGEENSVDVEGWVGSLTCNYCEGHAMCFRRTSRDGTPSGDGESDYESTQGDGEDEFSEARDTERDDATTSTTTDNFESCTRSASADTARDATAERPVSVSDRHTVSRSSSLGDGDGGGSLDGRQAGAVRVGSNEEEWCAGHVCLRLHPHGLRESKEKGRQEADTERSEEASCDGSDAESEEDEDPDGSLHDGANGAINQVSSRSSGTKQKGIPLSSIVKGFAAGRNRLAVSSGVSSEQSSKSLEAFAWGDNAAGCLGLPLETSAALTPGVVEPWGFLPGERVVAVACSERHSLLVTNIGSVYATGDGRDGALGLGNQEGSEAFRLVEWFAEQRPPPRLCQASVGSDLIGCHSAALDVDGRLYTWGIGAAAGHSSLKPILLPREVETLGGFGTGGDAHAADGRPAGLQHRVEGVACGGGFTVAVSREGKVFSWGSWARGRLGLGTPPERTARGKKKVPRFQATPRRVSGLGSSPVLQVAAGAWHGMALTRDGEVFTWGHNASGQLGFLVTPSSLRQSRQPSKYLPSPAATTSTAAGAASATVNLSDMLRASWKPFKLPTFGNCAASHATDVRAPVAGGGLGSGTSSASSFAGGSNGRIGQRRAVHIACGPEHSIAIDSRGAAWTWGAEGRACLGHGEAGYGAPGGGALVAAEAQARAMGLHGNGSNKEQQSQPFVSLSRGREVSRTRARRALAGGWAAPRMIASLSSSPNAPDSPAEGEKHRPGGRREVRIVAAAGGFSHTALITDEGKLCLIGEGAAVAGGDLSRLADAIGGGRGAGLGLREGGGLVRRSEQQGGPDPLMALSAVAGPTPVPREACAAWFPALASRRVAAVACAGQHVITLLAGNHIGYTLGINLFRAAMGAERCLLDGDKPTSSARETNDGADDDEDCEAVRGSGAWTKAGVDCELLVAGSYLHAHRMVLASRSPVLRDMIAQEERPGNNDEGGAPLKLLLPDLRFDVARALLEFLYTGDLRRSLDLDSPLPYGLRAAAKSYGVPRLEALCTEAIALGIDPEGGAEGWGQVVPPPTLAADLGGALGSMEHADVKFLAGGRPVYAHRAVLSSESDYFTAMFRFRDNMADGIPAGGQDGSALAEIVVPDSYTGFVRLLLFLYTGVLPDSNPDDVLEDLVAADRYQLFGMKHLCQSMLRVNSANCLQALRTVEMTTAPLLRESALFYVEHNLSEVSQQESFHETMSGAPGLAEVILSRLHAAATNASTISSATARQRRLNIRQRQQNRAGYANDGVNDGDLSFRPDSPFPWGAACVAVVCGAIYYRFSNVVAVGMLVPIVNGVFFVCLAVFAFHKLKAKGATSSEVRGKRGRGIPGKGSGRKDRGGNGRRKGGHNSSTYLFG